MIKNSFFNISNTFINGFKHQWSKGTILMLLLGAVLPSFWAQPYANSWINYNQQYLKFKVVETGIYRISQATLLAAGVPLSNIDARNIQIFGRGEELPLYIEGEDDGTFDANDFIEFYAQRNDGWYDEAFYGSPENHPNPYYSLINDTIHYFLTWNNSINNNRYALETDVSFSGFTPIDYFMKEEVQYFSDGDYYDGETVAAGISGSLTKYGYDPAEGWFDVSYNVGGSTVKSLVTDNAYSSGPDATIDAVVLGESNFAPVIGDHHLRVTGGSSIFDSVFEGYQKIDIQLVIPSNELGVTTDVAFTSINDLGTSVDRQAVAYVKITYPHSMNLGGASTVNHIFLDDNTNQSKSYIDFTNFSPNGSVIFYDLTSERRITVEQNGSSYRCLVPNSGQQKECILTSSGDVSAITVLEPVNATGTFTDYSVSIVDSAFLIVTHASLLTEAANYANYRNTSVNNAQNALVIDVEELYDQFAYGITKHPYAIRNFVDYTTDNWTSAPMNLFLLGKSIKAKQTRKNTDNFHNNLVPSYGNPASDHLLTAGINGTINEPALPTGRLAAENLNHIEWYLDKIQEHENPLTGPYDENQWMKTILHFAGGRSEGEAALFKGYLDQYKAVIEDTLFGGNVNTYVKESTVPVQLAISDEIKEFIAEGVGMMTFFGHASATGGFDQNIDNPTTWPDQQGRYPFLLGNSCLTGDIHLPTGNSTSEDYVIVQDRGVIGFLASADLGIANELHRYSTEFYARLGYKNYQQSIGEQIIQTIKTIQGTGEEYRTNATCLGMTLHGDPSVSLNIQSLPDYMVNENSVTYTPNDVTSDVDSFEVNVLITNLGKATADSIVVTLTRMFPNNSFSDTTYTSVILAPAYQETVVFKLPVDIVKGLGENTFHVFVDRFDEVEELYEINNEVTSSLTIFSGEVIPIYPYEYAIVPEQGVTLKASTASSLEPARDYVIEIDTTDYFTSPLLERTTVNQIGGVISWTPSLLQTMPDSSVYFWRVSKDSIDETGYSWRNSSFQYIPGKRGWEQDHFFQFEPNQYSFLQHNRNTRRFEFVDNVKQLKSIIYGASTSSEYLKNQLLVNATEIANSGNGVSTALHLAVFDSLTLEPWDDSRDLGQLNLSGGKSYFAYLMGSATQMQSFANTVADSIPDGSFMIAWTWMTSSFTNFAPLSLTTRNAFQNLGATQIPLVQDSIPFSFFMKKGDVGSIIEVVGDSIDHKNLSLSTNLVTSADYGMVSSVILGPSIRWDSLSWNTTSLEDPTRDNALLSVYGVQSGGQETLLIENLPLDSARIRLSNQIDAATYPYLKLDAYLEDDSLFSAPQLDRWHVTYEEFPEAAIDPFTYYTFYNDTVDEGEEIELSIAVRNIGDYDMDSLLIAFSILDQNNEVIALPYDRQKPLLVDSVFIATIRFSSVGLSEENTLMVEVNPGNDQPEMFHFNNLAQVPFYVRSDKINPVLDVTFDGVHILDGDIVSPQTEVVITLTDENPYLVLDDTSDYTVYITYPNGTEHRIPFSSGSSSNLVFEPASLPQNKSRITYQGNFSEDGNYKLRVQASDASSNASASADYIIGFEIVNKSTVTNVLTYPNPFTTSTRFVFTLTGNEIPDVFKIQIMTISGKVVREIHKDELGPIRIGRNISSFAWDGTDKYGDRLAKGLYLYKVNVQLNNEALELRQSDADGFFKKGIGKMYLLR